MVAAVQQKLPTSAEISFNRTFNVSCEHVFKAWTDPALLAQWWGPTGFTAPTCEIDARPGGKMYIVMRGPDGTDYPMSGRFEDVIAPEKLVFTDAALENGQSILEGITTALFTCRGDKTLLNLSASAQALTDQGLKSLQDMEQGWSQSLDRLTALVEAKK